jgi:type IV pilus assembly protein PilC
MLYTYEASDKDGVATRGEFEAQNKAEVVEFLQKKNLIPVRIEGDEEKKGAQFSLSSNLFETVKPLDRILLVRNLTAALKAGLGIVEAIDILVVDTTKNVMRKILIQAKINLQNGQPLSQTFISYPKYFPPVFVGMVKAGEFSGRLDGTLEELGAYLAREYSLTKKVKSSLAYPIFLLVAAGGVITLLLTFVIPRLAKAFKQSKVELPWITKMFIAIGNALNYSYLVDVAVLGIIIWFFVFFRKTDIGRRFFLWVSFRIPFIRNLVKKVALVRLTRTLGSLVASGVAIVDALRLSAESVSNPYYKKAILESIDEVQRGIPFSRAFKNYPNLFPNFLTGLILVGEKTGTLEHVLKTFADFYDEEIDNTLKDLTSILEPVLLLIMGVIVGGIALSVLLPIYQLVGSF